MLTWTLHQWTLTSGALNPWTLSSMDTLIYSVQHPATLISAFGSWPHDSWVLAQQFQQDILGDLGKTFNTFVKTGRLWALLIGFVIGYIFRSLTSYG